MMRPVDGIVYLKDLYRLSFDILVVDLGTQGIVLIFAPFLLFVQNYFQLKFINFDILTNTSNASSRRRLLLP